MPLLNYTTIAATKTVATTEHWKPVPISGYEEIYSISDKGRVRREITSGKYPAGHILTSRPNIGGYLYIRLRKPGGHKVWITIHRLVVMAFIGLPSQPRLTINHKDGNRQNNNPLNLEWMTYAENRKHAIEVLHDDRRGEAHPLAKLDETMVHDIRKRAENGERLMLIADDYGMNVEYIRLIVKRERWKHI